ncbi:MAG: xanthine dehydrogenase family protein molybdopterin-binding subunit [Pseudomonadota bacterium]
MEQFEHIGKRIPKIDAVEKATGKSKYIQDISLPGMLYGKILYSKYAHAKIKSIDTSKAEKLSGVRAVLTGKDVPQKMRMGFYKDNPPLKSERVRSFRDEVAAVAATSPEIAKAALKLIEVKYEALPGVFDPEEAMTPDAPLIHEEQKSNILKLPWKMHFGDVEAARKEAAYIVEGSYSTTWVSHCCMGTSGALAEFDTKNNLTITTNTQIPSLAQKDFKNALKTMGLADSRVRVIKPCIGGGFGSKLDTYAYEHIAILLAFRTRQPVKIVFEREEEFVAISTRQPTRTQIAQGCDKEGKLLFRDVKMILDNGAYTSWGATTPNVMLLPIASLYRVDNVRFEATCVYTNNTYSQAFRGYGNPQATFAIESSMDELAEKAGIDRVALRQINRNQPGDVTCQGAKITSCGFKECIDAVIDQMDWNSPKEKGVGFGLASLIHVGGGARIYQSDGCGTRIHLDDFGKAYVFSGATDIGQGADNVIAQIVAEELGLQMEDIDVKLTDTDVVPWDVGAHASRTTFVAGNSALRAAGEVKKILLQLASEALEIDAASIVLRNRMAFAKGAPDKNVTIDKLCRNYHFRKGGQMLSVQYFYDPPHDNLDRQFRGNNSMAYSFGAHGVKVKVDEETGQVEILDYVAAHDVGRALNPMLLEGQVYGGVLMGVGYALKEQVLLEKGKNMNPNFRDYKVLTAKDAISIKTPVIETIDENGPFGAKGIGEPGCVPTAPAIANAIYDAVGVRMTDLPITPERVLAAIKAKKGMDPCGNPLGGIAPDVCITE